MQRIELSIDVMGARRFWDMFCLKSPPSLLQKAIYKDWPLHEHPYVKTTAKEEYRNTNHVRR